ncbi:hypothetical protein BGZ51_000399 [Haplosporangium sp. Z 767]|nr:hypothetical protein BGZ51_000399 [Haplosporangium sp. Z 767]KAF9188980.1 hypothetical protein BGZ50_001013 [Haplosporangium sp. Z 11]
MNKYGPTSNTARSFAGTFEAVLQQDALERRGSETLKRLIDDKIDQIQLGLEAFKKPSSASRTAMAQAVTVDKQKFTDSQMNLAKRLSDVVKLNEMQALKIIEELSTETEIPESFTDDLVFKAVTAYWKERSSLVALLGEILKQTVDNEPNSGFNSIPAIDNIRSQSVAVIKKLLDQFSMKTSEEAPEFFAANPEYLDLWIGQSLTEQGVLLETMITLSYAGTDSKATLPAAVITTLLSTEFGKQQSYKAIFKQEAVDLWEDIRRLCVILSIASLDLGAVFAMSVADSYDREHAFTSEAQVQAINKALQSAERQEELGPFILAWSSVLSAKMASEPGDHPELRRLAAQLVYVSMEGLKVFSYLHTIFLSESFHQQSKDGSTYKRIFFYFFELVLLDHEPKAIKDFEGLVTCLAHVLRHETDLCDLIWEDSPLLGKGTLEVMETASGRFPLQLEPFLQLLGALATGGEPSASHAIYYFHHLRTLTHLIPLSSPSIEIDVNPTTGATVLRSIQDVPFGILPARPFMMLPQGMTGHLVSAENTAHIVRWDHQSSGWQLCFSMLDIFRQLNVDNYSPTSSIEIAHVKAIMDLLRSLFHHPAASLELLTFYLQGQHEISLIPTLFAILDQCSKFQKPPLDIIATTLECLTCLCSSYAQDVWLYLKQASFIPSIITTAVQFTGSSCVQTSGRVYDILTRFECILGNYTVTIAFLGLVEKLTIDAQNKELWDSKELRCLKAEVLYPCLAYIQNDIFTNYESWQYKNISDRFDIVYRILTIFNYTLDDLPLLTGTDPSEYIGLSTLQEYLIKNFLYDGGKQLALPLVSIIGSGPDLSAFFSRYSRARELNEIWSMVLQGLKFVKSLLRHRKISGGQPSFLEVYLVDRTVGRANQSLIHVLASYSDFSCGPEAAEISTEVLTLLCTLTFEWKARPSFVGYLGTTEQALHLVSTLVNRVGDDTQRSEYRNALWSLITITLTTQPGLATLFLSNDRVNPVTGVLENQTKGIAKNSILTKVFDIMHRPDAVLQAEPEILPLALHFLNVLWQNAKDHSVLIKSLHENDVFWNDLKAIFLRPDVHTNLELADWKDVASQYDGDALVQVVRVSTANAEQRTKAHILRILGLAIHFHSSTKGQLTKDLESLPKGIKEVFTACMSQDRFNEWNDTIPQIHYHVQGHRELKEMAQQLSTPFDYLKLAVRRWDETYDTDYLPGESFMLDLERVRFKLIWRGTENEHAVVRTVFHVNLNWSIVHSEMQLLSAWRFFVQVTTSNMGVAVWASRPSGASGPGTCQHFIICLLDHIGRDTNGSLVLRMARQDCCQILQSVIENFAVVRRSDRKNLATHFPEIVTKLQKLIQDPDMDVLQSIQNPIPGHSAHQALLLTVLYCYRALHDKEALSSLDPDHYKALQRSAIFLLPLVCNCFSVAVQSHLARQHDHTDDIVVLLALLEEICHPAWNPHPALWIPVLRNIDIVRLNLQLCARSVSSCDFNNRPSFFDGSLNLLLALANVSEMAAYLCDAGIMSMLTHNGLTPLLQRGEIEHMDQAHGDRGNWHHAWCMILATVTSLLRSMGTSDAFLQLLIGFIQLYGNQISKGLDTSTDQPLTSAKLEEMERITMLFYELSKHDNRLESLGGGEILRAFFDRSLFILQHAVYLFTHPHTLASVIVPITKEEYKDKETGHSSALMTLIEGKLAAVVRNILSAILAWTDPALILTKSHLEWPIRKTTIAPITDTPVYEPASIGTMFDLVQYAITSLKEWEARLEGKTGGSAGLYKDAKEDDRTTNASASSSTSAASSKTSSKLALFGDLSMTGATAASTATPSSTPSTPATSASSPSTSGTTSLKSSESESAFATLSTTTGSSVRMISLLEDALVVIATQLGLYMYHPQLEVAVRRDIQDQCMDLISALGSTQRMLQRFENVPVQTRKEGLGTEAYAQIRSLRDTMIPIIKNFAETKINI